MKTWIFLLVLWILPPACMGAGVFFADNYGNAMNARVVLATPTATQVKLLSPLNHTLVVMNDDAENPVFYGDSTCTLTLGQKINPLEKVTFQGVDAGFNFYVCTAVGSAEVRLVEHS